MLALASARRARQPRAPRAPRVHRASAIVRGVSAAPTSKAARQPGPRGHRAAGGSNARAIAAALGVVAMGALAVVGHRSWAAGRVTLTFHVGDAARPATPLQLTVFPDVSAVTAPSPPQALAELTLAADAALTLTADEVSSHAVVRFRGDGIGAGCVHVQLGQPMPAIALQPPGIARGRVVAPTAVWLNGWRCAGLRPVADAEVTVMTGGGIGIDLGVARTAADGTFTIAGIDTTRDGLGLRVRAAGCALAHAALQPDGVGVLTAGDVALEQGAQRQGLIAAPPGFDCGSLLVLARGLPGVQTRPAADGRFTLDHLPERTEPRLLLLGVPPTLAHREASAAANAPVRIELVQAAMVRGRVRSAIGKPAAGALVWIGDQDAVRTDDDGCFELVSQLPGEVAVQAQWESTDGRRRRHKWLAARRLQLAPGATVDGVELVVTDR